MGGGDLDLDDVELAAHEVEIRVFTLMGGVDVRRGRRVSRAERRELRERERRVQRGA